MRVTLSIDSASDEEAKAFVYSFQRARINLMEDGVADCTVRMMGAWNVTTPPITPNHARVMAEDFFGWLHEQAADALMQLVNPPPAPLRAVETKENP